MATFTTRPGLAAGRPVTARATWKLQHYLALAGVPFLLWQTWNWVAWIASGPRQITEFRDRHSTSWIAARVVAEPLMVIGALVILVWVVRGCRRQRRLTFDAQFVIASALLFWWDPMTNFYQQLFLYSSNWTNLNTWCSQTPFVVNPQCGRLPEPMVFIGLVYIFGFLGAAIIVNTFMRRVWAHWPNRTPQQILAVGLVGAMTLYLLLDTTMIRLDLWRWAGYPDTLSLFGPQHRLPASTALAAVVNLGPHAAIRFFKDDRGRTVLERNIDHLPPRRRTLLSLFALIGCTQLLFAVGVLITILPGPYSSPWPDYPDHLVTQLCDNANIHGTAYGPCPGNPDYQMPIK